MLMSDSASDFVNITAGIDTSVVPATFALTAVVVTVVVGVGVAVVVVVFDVVVEGPVVAATDVLAAPAPLLGWLGVGATEGGAAPAVFVSMLLLLPLASVSAARRGTLPEGDIPSKLNS